MLVLKLLNKKKVELYIYNYMKTISTSCSSEPHVMCSAHLFLYLLLPLDVFKLPDVELILVYMCLVKSLLLASSFFLSFIIIIVN